MKHQPLWTFSLALLFTAAACSRSELATAQAAPAQADASTAQPNTPPRGQQPSRAAPQAAPAQGQQSSALSAQSATAGVQLRVTPYDVVLRPGEKVKFTVQAFDAKGNPVQLGGPVQWSVGQLTFIPPPRPAREPVADLYAPQGGEKTAAAGAAGGNAAAAEGGASTSEIEALAKAAEQAAQQPQKIGNLKGEVAPDGTFTVPSGGAEFMGGAVTATAGGATGEARVRVVPPLPWAFDFEKAAVDRPPLTWLGAGGKFAVQDKDGNKVLTKLLNLDLYARARTNFGPVDLSGYTIQADVNVGSVDAAGRRNMPDAGVINQKYVLVLLGTHQQIQIHEWPSELPHSLNRTLPYKWEPNAWYTLKLRVQSGQDKALIEGKAWKKGEPEPQEWTIRLEDGVPQSNGAPGLYGNSLVTPIKSEIHYDNILVTDNKAATAAAR